MPIFGLFDALLLRPLPVPEPERLVSFEARNPKDPDDRPQLPYPVLADIERRQTVFTAIAAYTSAGPTVEADGVLSNVGVAFVSERFFDVFQVGPQLGRLLTANDLKTAAPVAVMTDTYWLQRYSRDPRVLGSIVKLQGVPFTIVGISARGFAGVMTDATYAFVVPLTAAKLIDRAFGEPGDGPIQFWNAFGRLAPGIGIDEARAQLEAMWPAVREANVSSKGPPKNARNVSDAGARRELGRARVLRSCVSGGPVRWACWSARRPGCFSSRA